MPEDIAFFYEDLANFRLSNTKQWREWLQQSLKSEGKALANLNYIFCKDDYLIRINQEYLQHDTYTDIITFDNTEPEASGIEADIFISIERVKENAQQLAQDFRQELARVMVHGLLHLAGYPDKTPTEAAKMRAKEEEYLLNLPESCTFVSEV